MMNRLRRDRPSHSVMPLSYEVGEMDIYSSGVSWAVYLLAIIVAVAFLAFAIEEVARHMRHKEQKRIQKQAWQQYTHWVHNSAGQRHAHK
jgi:hypothetical protein